MWRSSKVSAWRREQSSHRRGAAAHSRSAGATYEVSALATHWPAPAAHFGCMRISPNELVQSVAIRKTQGVTVPDQDTLPLRSRHQEATLSTTVPLQRLQRRAAGILRRQPRALYSHPPRHHRRALPNPSLKLTPTQLAKLATQRLCSRCTARPVSQAVRVSLARTLGGTIKPRSVPASEPTCKPTRRVIHCAHDPVVQVQRHSGALRGQESS